jgi:hypothetical protein
VEERYKFTLGVAAVVAVLLLLPFLPSLVKIFAVSPGASLVQEGTNLEDFSTSRNVFYHGGYWVITRSLTDGSLCYFYSSDGTSWSEPRQIELCGNFYNGRGADAWKEPYPSPYVHIAYFGQDGNLYYRRGTVSPSSGTIFWEDRTVVEEGTGSQDFYVDICVSENNVWLFYQTNNSSEGYRVRCLNTGFYFDTSESVKESAADKQMAPLPGGKVAIYGDGTSGDSYTHKVLTVSTSGVEQTENVLSLGRDTYNLNVVRSGDRLYVAFPWDENNYRYVSVYSRLPSGWVEVYRSEGESPSFPNVVSMTATPTGGLVLFYMRGLLPNYYYTKGVMVKSTDGINWGEEEEVLHSDPDEAGIVFCDSSYCADAGKVPTVSISFTSSFIFRMWFWKTEVAVPSPPPPPPPPPPPRGGVSPLYSASLSFTVWVGSGGQEKTSFVLGEVCTFRVAVVDASGRPVEGATVLVQVGSLQVPVTHVGNGIYEGSLDTSQLGEGTFTATVSASAPGYVSPSPQTLSISVSRAPPRGVANWVVVMLVVLVAAAAVVLVLRRRE